MDGEGLGVGREYFPDHVLGDVPAVATGFALKLDSRWAWRFRCVRFKLVADANAANRFVTVDFCDPEGTVWESNPALAVQVANATQLYDFARNRCIGVSGIATQPQFATLTDVWLPPGWQVQINVANVQAGDQLSLVKLYVDKLVSDSV